MIYRNGILELVKGRPNIKQLDKSNAMDDIVYNINVEVTF